MVNNFTKNELNIFILICFFYFRFNTNIRKFKKRLCIVVIISDYYFHNYYNYYNFIIIIIVIIIIIIIINIIIIKEQTLIDVSKPLSLNLDR